jgi:uncharacterized protein (DUF1499 family)
MLLFAVSGLIGMAAVAAGIAVIFTTRDALPMVAGLAGALPLVLVFASLAGGLRYPAINDITTDVVNPPEFQALATLPENAGRDLSFPAEFAEIITRNYPEVQPMVLPVEPGAAFEQALETAEQFEWAIISRDREAGVIEAVSTTRIFRFRDDVVIRVTEAEGGSRVDMRSKSRVGKSDLGANAQRISAYFDALRLGL